MAASPNTVARRAAEWVAQYRRRNPDANRWASGYGVIEHTTETQARIFKLEQSLKAQGAAGDGVGFYELLHSLDRVASAGLWLVAHETYAQNVHLDGRNLGPSDFKPVPEGHTGGALNMVPAYAGYLAANALTGHTRAWAMGQGHCVAAVDSLNLLVNNMTPAHAARYDLSDEGLTRYVRDFYSYRLNEKGRQDSPLGSHVNANTAGGISEGGYLGFMELQYVHMPLPGERLVAFLSDGAFEEQRGSDWAPRWWRSEDCGLVTPIMICNGRRIDQRTTMSQQGGVDWFADHLRLNSFDPAEFDGRDPAAFVWAIIELEQRLAAAGAAAQEGADPWPVRLPYGLAVAPKGYGFFGAGTNLAHNLPLGGNPSSDPVAVERFNESARRVWVPLPELRPAINNFQRHVNRPQERDHALATRDVSLHQSPMIASRPVPPPAARRDPTRWTRTSPMQAVDSMFLATVKANPHLRPRIGNPDEMRSNRMQQTLDALKFRVTAPEPGMPEDVHGAVITALNEEAVVSAALANKGGINITITYEAFGAKMFGALRQEVIFAKHCHEVGRPQRWLSIPLILTSHTWENAKNEQSHQDPSMAEAMLGETSDVSRVVFPPDYNTAAAAMRGVYQTRGQFWTLVVPKLPSIPDLFSAEDADRLLADGAIRLDWAGHQPDQAELILTAIGAYQLEETLKASLRLAERGVPHVVNYMLEPGRFRLPRNDGERERLAPAELRDTLWPAAAPYRVFVCHTRPEAMLGVLRPLSAGYGKTAGLGFASQGGTLTVGGLLFINGCSWAHVVETAGGLLQRPAEVLLTAEELAALRGQLSPHGVVIIN